MTADFTSLERVRGGCLALLLTAAVGLAHAQTIIHTVPPQSLVYSYLAPGHDIDVNGDGIPDFNLSTPNGIEIDLNPLNDSAVMAIPEVAPDLGAFVAPLPLGTSISASLNSVLIWYDRFSPQGGTAFIVACTDIGCSGYFQNQTDAYAGLRLSVGGRFYFGWIHIRNFGLNWGEIADWAFETRPDTPISAGEGADIDQLCPCDGPWKNHGDYVSHIQTVASRYVSEGLITEPERSAIISKAAASACGKRH